jgi:D-aminoacyl-tRNA deacylase
MRAVIQRVTEASVTIGNRVASEIGSGLLILAGIEENDNEEDVEWLSNKIIRLRIFNDKDGIMNIPVNEAGGDMLVVSQFTLHALTKKGNRPSYIRAARPEKAIPLYNLFIKKLGLLSRKRIRTGEFGAMMKVQSVNDGPVTIIIDTREKE